MPEMDDHQLLARFASENSETAFTALVTRHLALVYSVALRHTSNAHAAEEIPVACQYPWCSAAWFERTASTGMVKSIYRFKTDKVSVADEFVPDAEW
jgi:hypothetical protein